MNIMLTRPLIDTENLMTELLKLGHNIIHIPTLKITSLNMKPIDLSEFKALIFTSANSVRNLNILSSKSDILCFCVGSITEKIARGKGFINTISAEGTLHVLKNLISNSEYLEKDSNNFNRFFTARGFELTNQKSIIFVLSEIVIYSGINR